MALRIDEGLDDYLLLRTADAVETLERIQEEANLSGSGTAVGQIAVWNGAAFVPGILIGDSNGLTVAVITSPSFGLQAALQQDLKTTASPSFAALTIGGGTQVKKIQSGTVNADPGSIAAQTRGSVDVTITGVAVGDHVVLSPPDGLNTGLLYAGCRVTGANTVRIYLGNITGVAIDDGSLTWNWLWFDLT